MQWEFKMAMRAWIRSRSGLVLIVLAGVGLFVFLASWTADPAGDPSGNYLFFSSDDGRSWFKAPATNVPPFDHDGKQAHLAFVWTADGGKTQFVSHLLRYTPAGLLKMRTHLSGQSGGPLDALVRVGAESEVKRPGEPESAWILSTDPRASEITTPKSPNLELSPQPVYP
jgi:hypothetical protein